MKNECYAVYYKFYSYRCVAGVDYLSLEIEINYRVCVVCVGGKFISKSGSRELFISLEEKFFYFFLFKWCGGEYVSRVTCLWCYIKWSITILKWCNNECHATQALIRHTLLQIGELVTGGSIRKKEIKNDRRLNS